MTNNRVVKVLGFFKVAAIVEGISFLILLLIAMPLKYYADLPQIVKYFGWVHGLSFVIYLSLAFEVGAQLNKKFGWLMVAFLAGVIPFGTFFFDKYFKKNIE